MNKKGLMGILTIILIVLVLSGGYFIYTSLTKSKAPEGAVHWVEEGKDIYCLDSDNGFDTYQKGTLTLYDKNNNEIKDPNGEVYTDSCFGENQIREYSCNSGDLDKIIDCSNGCTNGACVR